MKTPRFRTLCALAVFVVACRPHSSAWAAEPREIVQDWAARHADATFLEITWISDGVRFPGLDGLPTLRYSMERLRYGWPDAMICEMRTVNKPDISGPAPLLKESDFAGATMQRAVSRTRSGLGMSYGFRSAGIDTVESTDPKILDGAFRTPWLAARWIVDHADSADALEVAQAAGEEIVALVDASKTRLTFRKVGADWECVGIEKLAADSVEWAVEFSDFGPVEGTKARHPSTRRERRMDGATAKAILAGRKVPFVLGQPYLHFATHLAAPRALDDRAFELTPANAAAASDAAKQNFRTQLQEHIESRVTGASSKTPQQQQGPAVGSTATQSGRKALFKDTPPVWALVAGAALAAIAVAFVWKSMRRAGSS